jgi:hypothetical protein
MRKSIAYCCVAVATMNPHSHASVGDAQSAQQKLIDRVEGTRYVELRIDDPENAMYIQFPIYQMIYAGTHH